MPKMSRKIFMKQMLEAMQGLGWNQDKINIMWKHLSSCPESTLERYQQKHLGDDYLSFDEMKQIAQENFHEAETHMMLLERTPKTYPGYEKDKDDIGKVQALAFRQTLLELVQVKEIDGETASKLYVMSHVVGQRQLTKALQARQIDLTNKEDVKQFAKEAEVTDGFSRFNRLVVYDPELKLVMPSRPAPNASKKDETAQDIAMRVIFGAKNYAGMTNINCMPIVKLHGELAELGGEITGANRDLKDDMKMMRTYSMREAYNVSSSDPNIVRQQVMDKLPQTHVEVDPHRQTLAELLNPYNIEPPQ